MATEPSLSVTVHVKDDTKIEAVRVSSSPDFISLKFGWQSSILLTSAEQAKALYVEAVEAYKILKQIETDAEIAEIAEASGWTLVNEESVWGGGTVTEEQYRAWVNGAEDPGPCSIASPCPMCQYETDNEVEF